MGRYYFNKKDTVEESRRIEMPWLRQHNWLNGMISGTLSWKSRWSESSVSAYIHTIETEYQKPFMRLIYSTAKDSEQKREFDYNVSIVSTPCNFKGKRFWFICPLVKDNSPCGRKVSKLYMPPGSLYFGCRKCHDLTYSASQEHNHHFESFQKVFDYEKRIEKLYSAIGRKHYRGRPTKKYLRYLKYKRLYEANSSLMAQMDNLLISKK